MKREAGTGLVPVYQTRVGLETRKPARLSGGLGYPEKYRRHRRPRQAAYRIARVITVSTSIAHPP